MGMDMESGNIRELNSVSELKDGEVLFRVKEKLEIKGCHFQIKEIYGEPFNEIVIKGISKLQALMEETKSCLESFEEKIKSGEIKPLT